MIALLQAAKAVKQLQIKHCFEWLDCGVDALLPVGRFRVKPEPREWTVTVFGDGHINSYGSTSRSSSVKVREVL